MGNTPKRSHSTELCLSTKIAPAYGYLFPNEIRLKLFHDWENQQNIGKTFRTFLKQILDLLNVYATLTLLELK